MSVCVAKHIWTVDEFVTAMHRHRELRFGGEVKLLIKVACSLLLAFLVVVTVLLTAFPYDRPVPYWAFALCSLFCVYGLIYDRVDVWYWKRRFRKRHNDPDQIDWTFFEDAVQMKTDLGESSVKWQAYLKIVEVRDGFMLYVNKNLFSWIPFKAFETSECIDTVRDLILKSKCQFIQRR